MKRESLKFEQLINFCQGGISVQEYPLKFLTFSKYDPSLASNMRDEISQFVTGVFATIEEECRATILQEKMDFSR